MVDFDRRRPISGSFNLGRKKKREKKGENLESDTCSPGSRSIAEALRNLPTRA
ncbi:hypothetical protein BHM03_00056141, partial [Ensete ventricosum]